jgi:hypothetical protein
VSVPGLPPGEVERQVGVENRVDAVVIDGGDGRRAGGSGDTRVAFDLGMVVDAATNVTLLQEYRDRPARVCQVGREFVLG